MTARAILIVDDNAKIRAHVETILRTAGFEVEGCSNGDEFLKLSHSARFGLYVVDVGLGEEDGRDLVRHLRQSGDTTPVMILSADSQIDTKVSGLTMGADDYLTKPFHPRELVSRAVALMRRAGLDPARVLMFAGLQLDEESHEMVFEGRTLRLTRTEARAMAVLMKASGRTVRRDALVSRVTSSDEISDYAVDKTVSRLRKTLETLRCPVVIRTAKGLGYALSEHVDG